MKSFIYLQRTSSISILYLWWRFHLVYRSRLICMLCRWSWLLLLHWVCWVRCSIQLMVGYHNTELLPKRVFGGPLLSVVYCCILYVWESCVLTSVAFLLLWTFATSWSFDLRFSFMHAQGCWGMLHHIHCCWNDVHIVSFLWSLPTHPARVCDFERNSTLLPVTYSWCFL